MANLYLTHKCSRGCSFCFARKVLQSAKEREEILSIEEIERLLDKFPELRTVGLLGGEPFLYPHMRALLDLLRKRDIQATIFTSATNPLPDGLNDLDLNAYSMEVAPDVRVPMLRFVVNVGERSTYNEQQFKNLELFFEKYHSCASLSYTIFDLDNGDPDFLFDMIDKYDLQRDIRTGIALPIYKGGNQYIPTEQYKRAGTYLVHCLERAHKRNITMNMDCGFTACMFTDEQLGRMQRLGTELRFMCGAAVDIGPRLEVWNCFPLFQLGRISALEASSLEDLNRMLEEQLCATLGPQIGIFKECATCDTMKRGLCEGGCKSFLSINPLKN